MIHVFCNLEQDDGEAQPYCDMTFEIVEKRLNTACWHLTCKAEADPYGPVGFGVQVPMTGWHEQVEGEGDDAFHSFWGNVRLRSIGEESDRLLQLLADYYGIAPANGSKGGLVGRLFGKMTNPATFVTEIDCLAVGIASDPREIEAEQVHMKLFFDDGLEDGRYAEVFLNADLPSGIVMLNEKDEEYRSDLVHWLSLPGYTNANPHPGAPGVMFH